jgi:hypothetical protein
MYPARLSDVTARIGGVVKTFTIILFVVACCASLFAKPPASSQTARQALIEMLLAKEPGTFEKHLPQVAKKGLLRANDAAGQEVIRDLTSLWSEAAKTLGEIQTFDSGPVLVTGDDVHDQRHMEVIVEHDILTADGDEIELSVRSTVKGKAEPLPAIPRVTLQFVQEKKIWKLNDITVTLRAPLGDPNFVSDLRRSQNPGLENGAIGNLNSLLNAEEAYKDAHPDKGFTCHLSDLASPPEGSEALPFQPIDEELATGKRNGYVFSVSNCGTPPSTMLRITAVPLDRGSELRVFCSTELRDIRFAEDGKASTCLNEGVPIEDRQ